MKKTTSLFCLLLLIAASASAGGFQDFASQNTTAALNPFARDIGGIIGGTDFHSGRTLGFPGFDIGVAGSVQTRPDKDDTILRTGRVHVIGAPMVMASVGLPFNFDVVGRGTGYDGANVLGGGLRYGVHHSGALSPLPDITISAFGDRLHHRYFDLTHYSADAVASFGFPILKPYLGIGYDYTELTAASSLPAGLANAKGYGRGSRFTAGLNVQPLPLFYFYGAYTLFHSISGFEAGLGVRF